MFLILVAPTLAQESKSCEIPQDLQTEISSKYPGRGIVTQSDLDEDDRQLFQKEHGNACPGRIKLNFYGDGKPTFAFVLISRNKSQQDAELVLAHQVVERWKTEVLDTAKNSTPVIWSQAPGKYRDIYGEKELQAANPVVVFCEYNAWAIVYAWTGKRVSKVWLSD